MPLLWIAILVQTLYFIVLNKHVFVVWFILLSMFLRAFSQNEWIYLACPFIIVQIIFWYIYSYGIEHFKKRRGRPRKLKRIKKTVVKPATKQTVAVAKTASKSTVNATKPIVKSATKQTVAVAKTASKSTVKTTNTTIKKAKSGAKLASGSLIPAQESEDNNEIKYETTTTSIGGNPGTLDVNSKEEDCYANQEMPKPGTGNFNEKNDC